jgi:hypothetical protein
MTSLEEFLNEAKQEGNQSGQVEPASGSFSCQHEECDEVIFEGAIDRINHRLRWTCVRGHHSSVVI